MRWKNRRSSETTEHPRASGRVWGSVAAGGLALILALLVVFTLVQGRHRPTPISEVAAAPAADPGPAAEQRREPESEELEASELAAGVLADTEEVWRGIFVETLARRYRLPRTVLFRDSARSPCPPRGDTVGPFYCPGDSRLFLDLDFFDALSGGGGAACDFAQAYVIAHEVGHHVQNLLGIWNDVRARQGRLGEEGVRDLALRLELQADFLAGVWAHHSGRSEEILGEEEQLEPALLAAGQVGGDAFRRRAEGRAMPETFTHGTLAQRLRWFRLGYETGDLNRMDTFAVPRSQL